MVMKDAKPMTPLAQKRIFIFKRKKHTINDHKGQETIHNDLVRGDLLQPHKN